MDKKKGKTQTGSTDNGIPEAKYTLFGERIRQAIPGPMQCSVGCGGKNCKWENPARWSDADQAIKGVFSSWVLDNVVAMSRPSTEIIKKYKMIDQFKKHNIRSIINLQRPGEHASCGPPLEKDSLFTYLPQDFMDNDIFFYNFGWKDYGVASMDTILDMVKVMSFALEEGKVAVHCHAGLGRTGVLIACYLVYAERMDPAAAILRVRKNRSNSIQTRGQMACINEFWHFLRPRRIVFPQVVPHAKRLTLKQFLTSQRYLLHGFESRDLRHIPKLLHEICKRLCQIAHADLKSEPTHEAPSHSTHERCSTVAEIRETLPKAFVNEIIEKPLDAADLELPRPNVEAILSPRVARKGSARSVSSLDLPERPRSADDTKRPDCDGEVFSADETTDLPGTSGKTKNSQIIAAKKDEDIPSSIVDRAFATQNTTNDNERDNIENLKNIPDEQLEREVNEILGCNTNNNHTQNLLPSVGSLTNANLINRKSSPVGCDAERDVGQDVTATSSTEPVPSPENDDPNTNPQGSVRKKRRSAVQSETILPTGLPSKNPRSSAKEKRPSIIGRDIIFTSTESSSKESAEPLQPAEKAEFGEQTTTLQEQDKSGVSQGQASGTPHVSATEAPVKVSVANEDVLTSNKSNDATTLPSIEEPNSIEKKPMLKICDVETVVPTVSLRTRDHDSDFDDEEKLPIASDKSPCDDLPSAKIPGDDLPPVTSSSDVFPSSQSPDIDELAGSTITPTQTMSSIVDGQDTVTSDDVTEAMTLLGRGSDDVETASLLTPRDIALVDAAKSSQGSDLVSARVELQDVSDDDLDEIIDIPFDDDDDQRSMDGDNITQIDGEEVGGNLSQSIASRVSWVQTRKKDALRNDEVLRQASASSAKAELGGRRTPLMYRGEKNQTLLSADKHSGDDVTKSSSSGENIRGSDFSEEDLVERATLELEDTVDVFSQVTEAEVLRLEKDLKLPVMPRISAARSMNDLSSPTVADSSAAFSRCSSSGDMRHPSPHGHQSSSERINPTNVALAMAYKLIDDEWLWEKVYSLQIEINNHKDAWKSLEEVTDAYLLASLMWSWVEHLAEPILGEKDAVQLLSIIEKSSPRLKPSQITETFEKALGSLDLSVSTTIKCLLNTVTSFPALARRISESMVERILAALTQSPMPPAEKSKINADLVRVFQQYVSAKYEASNRKRFLDDFKQTVVSLPPKNVARICSTESDYSDCDDVTNDAYPVATEVNNVVRKSAGSVHSSGSSNTSISTQRIVVN